MAAVVVICVLVVIGLIVAYSALRRRHTMLVGERGNLQRQLNDLQATMNDRAHSMFETWRASTLDAEAQERATVWFNTWKQGEEKGIRKDAISKSQAVILGRVTEHLLPYLPEFPFNPRDARFLGSPIDFIVFDGLTEGSLRKVLFVEAKTGKSTLTSRERSIRVCVESGLVGYELVRMPGCESEPVETATT